MEASPATKKRKRKGGLQQRLNQAKQEAQQESALCALLMTFFAKGIMSGVLCHKIAQAAKKDIEAAKEGIEFPDLDHLAKLQEGRTLKRSVHTMLARKSSMPPPFKIDMPYSDGTAEAHVLLPHEYFAACFEKDEIWRQSILPDAEKLPDFWTAFQKHPSMQAHPVQKQKDWKNKFIPLSIHGDEVPVMGIGKIWSRSALSFSWSSMIANALGGQCADIMMFIWAVFEKFVAPSSSNKPGTMHTFWSLLRWSFEALWTGRWPTHDFRGIPYDPNTPEGAKAGSWLAGGYCAALVQFCGDLDYFSKWLGVPVSTNHSKPCCQCRCTFAGPSSWMDNRLNSPWQSTVLTARNWKQHWQSSCPLFDLPGMTAHSVALDLMHNFFLGWLQFAYGSVFYLLTHECLDDEPLQNLLTVGRFIKSFQKTDNTRHKCRQRLTKLTMFVRKSGFPKLKGRAADIMGLDMAMKSCWEEYKDPTNEHLWPCLVYFSFCFSTEQCYLSLAIFCHKYHSGNTSSSLSSWS